MDDVGKLEELDLPAFPAPRARLDFQYVNIMNNTIILYGYLGIIGKMRCV